MPAYNSFFKASSLICWTAVRIITPGPQLQWSVFKGAEVWDGLNSSPGNCCREQLGGRWMLFTWVHDSRGETPAFCFGGSYDSWTDLSRKVGSLMQLSNRVLGWENNDVWESWVVFYWDESVKYVYFLVLWTFYKGKQDGNYELCCRLLNLKDFLMRRF